MSETETSPTYNLMRTAYWAAQEAFRAAAVAEMCRAMPEGVETVVLRVTEPGSDAPHLTVSDLLSPEGESILDLWEDSDEYALLDQIARDVEANDWDEADSFLSHDSDGSFRIHRDDC